MVDPLSIIGGVASIGTVGGATVKCAQAFYKIALKAGAVREQVEFFANHIETFGSTITSAHNTIREHYVKYEGSTTLQGLGQRATLDRLAKQTKYLIRRLKDIEPNVKDRRAGLGFWGRTHWILFQKSEREELCVWMVRIQMAFILIMSGLKQERLEEIAAGTERLPQGLYDIKREM